jgi:DNA-binding ferritin-like protein
MKVISSKRGQNPTADIAAIRKNGLAKIANGKISSYDPEVLLASSIDDDDLSRAFDGLQETYLAGSKDPKAQKCSLMRLLLAYLRAAHWLHWTSHWQVQGPTYYGDHLLLERLYTSLTESIDTLAEKLVGEFGGDAVNPVEQSYFLVGFVNEIAKSEKGPIDRAYKIESSLQMILKKVYSRIQGLGVMNLGLDDFIMALANNHDTNLYLLNQRIQGGISK